VERGECRGGGRVILAGLGFKRAEILMRGLLGKDGQAFGKPKIASKNEEASMEAKGGRLGKKKDGDP